jgi:hypothetical protein
MAKYEDYKPREAELRATNVIERQYRKIQQLRAALQEIADDSDPNGFIDRNTRRAREALTAAQ